MALKAGRVGVNKNQVDEFGNITGGAVPENVYTKTQCDNKFETKAHIGGLQFRDNDGTAQYKLPNGDWVNFSSGGSGIGFNIPSEMLLSATPGRASCTIIDGGFAVVDGVIYVDVTFKDTSSGPTGSLIQCNLPEGITVSNTGKTSMYTDVVNSYSAGCNLIKGGNTRVDVAIMSSGLTANVEHRAYGQFVLNPV